MMQNVTARKRQINYKKVGKGKAVEARQHKSTGKRKRWDAIADRIPEDREITGAEIGVLNGNTSQRILKARPNLTLLMIDPWRPPTKDSAYYQTGDDNSHQTKEEFNTCYQTTKNRVAFAGDRAVIMKMKSETAVKKIEDGSLDFVFIDGDHSYEGVKQDIEMWVPKVKAGGFISGHDYDHPRLPGVKQAVDEAFDIVELDDNRTWFYKIQNKG